jgi:G3E family GTPase
VEALKELERRAGASGQPFDAVLLETTGVADPGPVVR